MHRIQQIINSFVVARSFSIATNPTVNKMAVAFVHQEIPANKVTVFGKSTCPNTKRVKELLGPYNLKGYKAIDIDYRSDMSEIQDELLKITGARTVPRVFISGKFVGGADDTVKLETDGKLKPLLQEAGAI